MRVYHCDTDTLLFLKQDQESYSVHYDTNEEINSFDDLSSALWHIIEQIRSISMRSIKERDFKLVSGKIDPEDKPSKELLMKMLEQQKIHKVFYDTAFLSMLMHHNSKKKYDLILENKTNFFLYDEIVHIIKMSKKEILAGSNFCV